MERCAPARHPEPIPLNGSPDFPDQGCPRSTAADPLRPLVAVLAEIAARVERERASQGADAA
jgi:hypothetical protein